MEIKNISHQAQRSKIKIIESKIMIKSLWKLFEKLWMIKNYCL